MTPTWPDSVIVTGLPACGLGDAVRLKDPWVTLTVVVAARLGSLAQASSAATAASNTSTSRPAARQRARASQISEVVDRTPPIIASPEVVRKGSRASANIIDAPVYRTRFLLDLLARPQTHHYGDHPSQRADLHLPDGSGPHPVVVVIHGGSWAATYGKVIMRPIACDLARHGWAVWNIEYRRIGRGQGGGWPATFEDVAAAVDHLDSLDALIDTARVVGLGHSAGGQLALWAAGRYKLPADAPGGAPQVDFTAVVSQAGVNDLGGAYRQAPGGAVGMLMGGSPAEQPDRYAIGDPILAVPLRMPVLLVHGADDQTVSVRRSRDYATAARAAGGTVDLVEVPGEAGAHRKHIDPTGPTWAPIPPWLAATSVAPDPRPGPGQTTHEDDGIRRSGLPSTSR